MLFVINYYRGNYMVEWQVTAVGQILGKLSLFTYLVYITQYFKKKFHAL